ncbi:MAG TPA: bifunctional diaminohydroxyphosphoribosylaminopyrimidine deaminase/5-amino-6-(5-phosphoribosylamino)uracil reductase RibD [Edaphobacter sp.]|jgi:diaminohydroxyphosphoribosylaminopyrimidine deaminase/5-amino-6-(5-phosphoribosylamino)uracil reductase|nr:bifunctional diaminohydroxyphosphoribosylaminopyrimidine deaminase/5-amino-6-(5-phosphoribosylamino)uracil reductase RibD [Edaphobacter sp.]
MIENAKQTQDEAFMQRALKLAAETIGLASPNPQVGCVITQTPTGGGTPKIIGEGAHLYDNRDHAEIVALKQGAARGFATRGATAYVTLEPCSHHGRTPPCANALIAAGITRCVVATQDPNPLVAGQGIQKLRAANIEVTLGVLEQPARDLNDAFAHFIQHRTPFVTLKAALSVDGKLAPPPASRYPNQPYWLTGPAARYEVQLLRHASDAVLTGIGTVLADDPQLTDRSGLFGPNNLPRRRPLLRVILDTHLRIPLTSQLVRSAASASSNGSESDLLILCGSLAPPSKAAALGSLGVEVDQIPDHAGRLSLPAVLSTLAERDILSLLLECGSHLNGAFLRQNLVDKAVLIYAETELGDKAIPFAQGIPSPYHFERFLHRITRAAYGPDACVTGYLHDPWPPVSTGD